MNQLTINFKKLVFPLPKGTFIYIDVPDQWQRVVEGWTYANGVLYMIYKFTDDTTLHSMQYWSDRIHIL